MKRTGYIDVIKFIFAIIIAEFHFNSGIFPGGRIAVEGFFMISAFLMMKSIEKSHQDTNIGISTISFMARKYKGLVWTLALSALTAFVLYAVTVKPAQDDLIRQIPLLLFDIFPLNTAGFKGSYVVGISWYLSSMFIALAMLYPLAKRFRSSFTLTACPLVVILGYGLLSAKYGNLAVGTSFLENTILHTGILRALAGSAVGCLIYEISTRIGKLRFTAFAKITFTIVEILLFISMLYLMKHHPKSALDYLLVFIIFAMLIIGINGLSYSAMLWNPKWTKFLGTASTLIVLNHFRLSMIVRTYCKEYSQPIRFLIYAASVAICCVIIWALTKLLSFLSSKILSKKLWLKSSEATKSGNQ